MLDEMTPQNMNELEAGYQLGLWGNEWQQSAAIAAAVTNAVIVLTAATQGVTAKEEHMVSPSIFMPDTSPEADESTNRQHGRRLGADEAEQLMRIRYAG